MVNPWHCYCLSLLVGEAIGYHQIAFETPLSSQTWAVDDRAEGNFILVVLDNIFWQRLEDLSTIIAPIREAQKMSEAANATLGHVIPRWLLLKAFLQKLATAHPEYLGDIICAGGLFSVRSSK